MNNICNNKYFDVCLHAEDANGGENGQSKSGVRGSHSPSAPSKTTQSSPHSDTSKDFASAVTAVRDKPVVDCGRGMSYSSCMPGTPGRGGAPNKKSSP